LTSRWVLRSAALSALAFVALTLVASAIELFPGERAVTRWLIVNVEASLRPLSDLLDTTFTDASATVVFVLLIPIVVRCWGRWTGVAFLLAGAATGTTRLAWIVARPRPSGDLEWASTVAGDGGYPSGHVVYMTLVFGALVSFSGPDRTAPERIIGGAMGAIIVVTGLSRVLVLDHWPIDVVGGYLLAWPLLVVVVYLHRVAPGRLEHIRARLDPNPGSIS
jgi:membrane-associated phospholipid phosphatase